MNVMETKISGLLVVEPKCFSDERGFFLECFQEQRYQAVGIADRFIQDNHSRSYKGVLRGLHFQVKRPQAQFIAVMRGRIYDAVVDLRPASSTFGQWFGIELSDEDPRQLYMAPGFAHGFCVLSDVADILYKVSRPYDPPDEGGLLWNDPDIGIRWPLNEPRVALRDQNYPRLRDLEKKQLPHDPPIG